MTCSPIKRRITKAAVSALSLFLVLGLHGCGDDEDEKDDNPAPGVSESLHFNFKTPDWERNIDCTHLDLPSNSLDATTYYVSATSASTNSTFFFSFPQDSSAIVNPANLKQYSIKAYGQNDAPFQLSLKLPLTEGNSKRLVSKAGQSAESYNEILAVKYDGHNATEAFFKVKAKYQMKTVVVNDSSIQKTVSGTFHFRIRTTRK
ncbi:hypothetical protein I5M27_10780 [Adhaeribacter sp. BT258]|uniref:Lipoprotein n=1 Tax=Adhaeribacter terrigena TaxID=2793070 RepID=A0ABS1C249_9BACT|nr:hypothetical protein [Adhaeribacter terrigena]MBK0403471.1 hypothetical protein [Adhaeribacter terrigena]